MYLYISQSCAAILKEEKKWLRGGVSERCLRLGGRAGVVTFQEVNTR